MAIERKPFHQFQKEQIRAFFDDTYQKLYGRTYPETPVEFVTFKVRAGLPERRFQIPPLKTTEGTLENCKKGERQAFSLLKRDFIAFSVYDRSLLFPGCAFKGPAIIEEKESTIIVGEDASVRIDEFGFVWIQLREQS